MCHTAVPQKSQHMLVSSSNESEASLSETKQYFPCTLEGLLHSAWLPAATGAVFQGSENLKSNVEGEELSQADSHSLPDAWQWNRRQFLAFFFFWNSFCISLSLCVYMTHLRGSHLHNIFFNSTCLIAYTIFGLLRMNYSFLQEIRPGYAKWCAQGHKKSIWQRKTISFNSHSRISPNASIHLAHMLPLPFCKKYCIWLHESCIF